MLALLAWAAAIPYALDRLATAEQAAIAQAERAATAGRALLRPILAAAEEALAQAEARQAAQQRNDRAAIAGAERTLVDSLRRDGLQFAFAADAEGRIGWASHASLIGQGLGQREAFAQHRGGRAEALLSPALFDLPGGPPSLLLTRTLADARGGFAGVVGVAIDPRRLDAALAHAASLPGLGLVLTGRGDIPLASSAPGLALRDAKAGPALPLPGGELTLRALPPPPHPAATESASLALAAALLVTFGALLVPWLRGHVPANAPGAGLEEALPAVGYRARLDASGALTITGIGAGVERLTGWTQEAALRPGWRTRGLDPTTLPLGPDLPERLLQESDAVVEYRFRRADGGWMWLRESARVVGRGPDGAALAGALEDISAERELEMQASAAAKFATLGEMAATLAHELNQPIAIMSLAAENAAEALEAGEDGRADALLRLRKIMTQADRAKAIVTQLRAFSRVDLAEVEPVDLGACVDGLLIMAGQALRDAEVEVELRLPDLLPPIVGQPILVEQVLLNLALNARDAMADRPPGQRRLRLEGEAVPGAEEVILRVADSGPGIPPDLAEKLFEPFYTTKAPGAGTGLGLSISRTIMRRSGPPARRSRASATATP